MQDALDDPDIPLTYTAKFREVGLRVLDGRWPTQDGVAHSSLLLLA